VVYYDVLYSQSLSLRGLGTIRESEVYMMKHRMWVVVVLTMLASLACSLGGALGTATEEATPLPLVGEEATTQPPAAGEEGTNTEEPPAPEIAPGGASGLNSYRSRMVWSLTPEEGSPETVVIEHEQTREPPAQRSSIVAEEETIEWVQIGDTAWFCSAGTCVQTQQSQEEMVPGFEEELILQPDDIADLVEGTDYRYVGQETINGIRTRHYILFLSPAEIAAMEGGEVSDVEGEVWIADEAGLPTIVIRFTTSWKETQEGQVGNGEFSLDVFDVNVPFTIEPPAGAEASLPEDVPLYPNATNITAMADIVSFSAPDDVETVAEFYRSELAALGWEKESDDGMAGIITQVWRKEGRALNLMISPQESGSSVLITLE